jgi:hypothetical protein
MSRDIRLATADGRVSYEIPRCGKENLTGAARRAGALMDHPLLSHSAGAHAGSASEALSDTPALCRRLRDNSQKVRVGQGPTSRADYGDRTRHHRAPAGDALRAHHQSKIVGHSNRYRSGYSRKCGASHLNCEICFGVIPSTERPDPLRFGPGESPSCSILFLIH